MFYPYKAVLLLFEFLIPLVIIAAGNDFRSWWRTALRFVAAVLALWGFFIFVRMIVPSIDMALATAPEERQMVYYGDGAKNVAARCFGWIPGTIIASLCWVCVRSCRLMLRWVRHRRKAR